MLAKALWHIDANTSEWRTETIKKDSNAHFSHLKTTYSMISTGTERLVANAAVPPAMHNQMTVPYMGGNFDLPIKYGYACGGNTDEGSSCHFMHPHQDHCWVNQDALFFIENDLPEFKVPLISNIETVLNAIWDAALTENQSVAICGFGNIGALLANTLRQYSKVEATVIEKNIWRKQKAQNMGWKVDDQESKNYDVIFHTTATEAGLQYCIDHLNYEGKVIELSWYGAEKIQLDLGGDFHYKRLSIKASQVGQISPQVKDQMTYGKRKMIAADILLDDSFDELVTDIIPMQKAPLLFDDIRKKQLPDGLIWLIQYD